MGLVSSMRFYFS